MMVVYKQYLLAEKDISSHILQNKKEYKKIDNFEGYTVTSYTEMGKLFINVIKKSETQFLYSIEIEKNFKLIKNISYGIPVIGVVLVIINNLLEIKIMASVIMAYYLISLIAYNLVEKAYKNRANKKMKMIINRNSELDFKIINAQEYLEYTSLDK